MTLRGRSSNRASKECIRQDFELTDRSYNRTEREDDSEEEVYPDTNASLLRRHRLDHGDGGTTKAGGESRLWDRLTALMSRTPLIGAKLSARDSTKYGALSGQASEPNRSVLRAEELADHGDGARIEHQRADASAAVRPGPGLSSFGSLQQRDKSVSRSRERGRRGNVRSSNPMLVTGPARRNEQGGYYGRSVSPSTNDTSEDEDQAIDQDALDPSDNSPYPQVRASVAATDDTSLSINTPRMWILSLLCALVGSATNLFFSLRYPSVAITPVIALVVVHPLGRLWDRLLKRRDDPNETFENGVLVSQVKSLNTFRALSKSTRLRLWLAQGNWNGKEHACVYVSSNVSFGFAFATDVIVEQSKFYHQDLSIIYQLLLTISTQILGYAFAGLTRRYLVRPPSMIWPGTLMSTAMFTTMHSSENKSANGWVISRWNFFVLVWSGAFAWYFLPGLLMPALSYFSVITWFAPKNVVVANLVSSSIDFSSAFSDSRSSVLLLGWGFSLSPSTGLRSPISGHRY